MPSTLFSADSWPRRHGAAIAYVALALALCWLWPPREVTAGIVGLAYLAGCAQLYRRHRRRVPEALPTHETLVAYASQGGQAGELAERTAAQLADAGLAVDCRALQDIDPAALAGYSRALFVVSTYGEGEAPDSGARFQRRLAACRGLPSLRYAVLALGDSRYRHFCAFGQRLDRRLRTLGAEPLFDCVTVDRLDPATLRHWQQELAQVSGHAAFIDWQPPAYQRWRLLARHCLNPGSQGWPVFHLALDAEPPLMTWRAGDIAEIGPRQPNARVEAFVRQLGLDPLQLIDGELLAELLAERQLPDALDQWVGLPVDALLQRLPRLAHREYSIASVPESGRLDLLVREMRSPSGTPGIGSGWLCREAPLGARIDLRIRSNPNFHGPDARVPLILIGNGTGLAGLLAHLHARAGTPGSRNWLLFGERNAAHDAFFAEQLTAWQRSGHLTHLDLAFSRDQAGKRYVQDVLREQAGRLRQWLDDGAALYLCGSLEGMGRDVQRTLVDLLGEAALNTLIEQHRYRRDLY